MADPAGAARLRDALWDELHRRGVAAAGERYRAGRAAVSDLGAAELARVRAAVGARDWRRALARFPTPTREADHVRILGFGRLLAEFAVAPLELAPPDREEAARLGALANFIVALYDRHVDELPGGAAVLRRGDVLSAATPAGRARLALAGWAAGPARRAMLALVGDYHARLRRLAGPAPRAAVLRATLRAIAAMYDAEAATTAGAPPGARVLRRKAALPFVVMALPAWLAAADFRPDRCRRHLRWAYRLGDFFGWVDDAVDAADDLRTGHPNRVVALLARGGADASPERLAGRIAGAGERLLAEWDAAVAGRPAPPPAVAAALPLAVCSWFGGTARPLPRAEPEDAGVA